MTPSMDAYPVQSVPAEYSPAELMQPPLADEPEAPGLESDWAINERRAQFENPEALRMLRSL